MWKPSVVDPDPELERLKCPPTKENMLKRWLFFWRGRSFYGNFDFLLSAKVMLSFFLSNKRVFWPGPLFQTFELVKYLCRMTGQSPVAGRAVQRSNPGGSSPGPVRAAGGASGSNPVVVAPAFHEKRGQLVSLSPDGRTASRTHATQVLVPGTIWKYGTVIIIAVPVK